MKPRPRVVVCRHCGHEASHKDLGARCPNDGSVLIDEKVARRHSLDPLLGCVLGGKYLLIDLVGLGGCGSVYRALQEPVGREVAVKVIRYREPASVEVMRARFFREAKVIGQLASDSTVSLYDYGEEDGQLYMVLELVRGRSLRQALRAEVRFAPERVASIATQVLESMAEAHEVGLVHRDLKPDNIMLVTAPFGQERVKVLDFGIAKVMGGSYEGGETIHTQGGVVVGTPRYMAPEQARATPALQSDLYALGVVLFEMVVGKAPFAGTVTEVLEAHTYEPVPEIPLELGAPDSLCQVIFRALEKRPEDRFATASEMAAALAPIADAHRGPALGRDTVVTPLSAFDGDPTRESTTGEMMGERLSTVRSPSERSGRRRWALAGGGIVAAAGIAAVGAWWMLRADDPVPLRSAAVVQPQPMEADGLYQRAAFAARAGFPELAAQILEAAYQAEPSSRALRQRAARDPAFGPHRGHPALAPLLTKAREPAPVAPTAPAGRDAPADSPERPVPVRKATKEALDPPERPLDRGDRKPPGRTDRPRQGGEFRSKRL